MDEQPGMRDAVTLGLRRAGLHWIRAGYEMAAGLGAFLDEVVRVRRDQPSDQPGKTGPGRSRLTRIDLD